MATVTPTATPWLDSRERSGVGRGPESSSSSLSSVSTAKLVERLGRVLPDLRVRVLERGGQPLDRVAWTYEAREYEPELQT